MATRFLWLLPLTRRQVVVGVLWPVTLTVLFCALLLRYWRFYHLDTPGSWMGVVLIIAPASLLLSVTAQWALIAIQWRFGIVTKRALPIASALVAALFAGAFALELSRTNAERSGEGIGAGDLAPFARSLVGLR